MQNRKKKFITSSLTLTYWLSAFYETVHKGKKFCRQTDRLWKKKRRIKEKTLRIGIQAAALDIRLNKTKWSHYRNIDP